MNTVKIGVLVAFFALSAQGVCASTVVNVSTGTAGETIVDVTPSGLPTQTTVFTSGVSSFADELVLYTPGSGFAGSPHCTDGVQMLGVPDYTASGYCNDFTGTANPNQPTGSNFASLGFHGQAIFKFTDNSLLASGNALPDLYVFEIGQAFEPVSVDVSANGRDWISVADTIGQPLAIDIDAAEGISEGSRFAYVRLMDSGSADSNGSRFAGADIDAIGAIFSAAPIPIPASGWALISGLAILILRARRKQVV